jgi:hypothetical protein
MLTDLVNCMFPFLFFDFLIGCISRSVMDDEVRECNPWMIAVGGYMPV